MTSTTAKLRNLRFSVGDLGEVQIRTLLAQGHSKAETARLCGCSRWAVYRALRGERVRKTAKKSMCSRQIQQRRALVRRYITKTRNVRGAKTVYARGRPSKQPGWIRPSVIVHRVTLRHCYPSPAAVRRVLAQNHSITVSRTTIRRDLKATGLKAYVKPRGPRINRLDEAKRLVFCRWIDRQPKRYLQRIVYSDEKIFDTDDHQNIFQYSANRDAVHIRQRAQGGPTVFAWAAIGEGFRVIVIVQFSGKGMDADDYLSQCIRPHARKLRGKILQADGARVHWTPEVVSELKRLKIATLNKQWPGYSPDLSCVENMWAILAKSVSERAPFGVEELRKYVEEEFYRIPQDVMNNLVGSMKSRAKECVTKQGGVIRR